jgi:hypothetical protein
VPSRQTHVQKYPRLTIGATQLFCHQSHGDQPTTIHAAPLGTARVINTLLRVVHGGSSGWGSLPIGQPPTADILQRTRTQNDVVLFSLVVT